MKIVVLAGGTSTERDVSVSTGTMVCRALRKKGHQSVLLDVYLGYEGTALESFFDTEADFGKTGDFICESSPDLEELKKRKRDGADGFFGPNVLRLCKEADIVFMALHGENGENGKIQAAFDLLGIKYTGSGYLGSAIAMDKNLSKQVFLMNGVKTPGYALVERGRKNEADVRFPCIVKPCCGGSSVGVSIAQNLQEYEKALEAAFRFEESVIVEDYIQGREFSVAVIEQRALPVIEIAPVEGFYDYVNKYQAGRTIETCPADLPKDISDEMRRQAERAYEVLGLEAYGRVDFMLNEENEMFCLEANTLPGMTPTSLLPQEAAAEGISFEELCENLIHASLKKYR